MKITANKDIKIAFTTAVTDLLAKFSTLNDDNIVIALPGGRSIVGLLGVLLEQLEQVEPSIRQKLHFFMLDERCKPFGDIEYNGTLIVENFFNPALKLGILSQQQFHPYIYKPESADWGLSDYESELNAQGGKLHIVIAGVGPDGHIASIFPHHPSCNEATSSLFQQVSNSPKPPSDRISTTLHLIRRAEIALGLFIGEEKRMAYQRFISGEEVKECPAVVLKEVRDLTIVTDLT